MTKIIKKEKLNIAMLGQKRVPSREGGIEVVVTELSTRMVELGHKVTCFNRKGHHVSGKQFDQERVDQYKGVKLVDVLTLNRRGFAAMTSSIFGALKAAFGSYDVVHFHAEGPAFMCWLPKLFGKKVIVTVHGLDHQRAKWGRFASAYIMMGERNSVRFADKIIVLSKDVKDYFKKTYNRETVYIPNGVNASVKQDVNLIKEKWGLEGQDYILYLGRIVPEKGLTYLLNAYNNVNTDKKLVIAGGVSGTEIYMSRLKEIAESNPNIIFTDFVQGQELAELFSNNYVYCLPSDLEGMPLSLLEAMSYGNCCLVSDISECTEVVEDKAVVFKKGDEKDLQEKIQFLCDNPELVERYKSSSKTFILNKYIWDDVVNNTLKLYRGE